MRRQRKDWSEFVRPEDLGRELSLHTYVAEQLAELGLDPNRKTLEDIRQQLNAFRLELEELQQPGDTWREWLEGTELLMQSGGLALIRDGKIVWAVQTWVS